MVFDPDPTTCGRASKAGSAGSHDHLCAEVLKMIKDLRECREIRREEARIAA
jgi:hypothetical protein